MKMKLFLIIMILLLPIAFAKVDSNCSSEYSEQQMLANFVKTGDPALDLYNFANDNNLSMEEAKKILKKNFGNPKVSKEKYFNKITRTQNPDEDLKAFALANNLTNDEAKIILIKMFGEPEIH